jgi:hypothetical protein
VKLHIVNQQNSLEGRYTVTYHSLKWWIGFHGFLKCTLYSDVLNNGEIQLVFADVWVRFLDLVRLLLASDGRYDGMSIIT